MKESDGQSRDGPSELTAEEAARKVGVSTKTLERAKFVADFGTEDEKQAVRHGKATVKELERELRARGCSYLNGRENSCSV